jgi:hypothetical protein
VTDPRLEVYETAVWAACVHIETDPDDRYAPDKWLDAMEHLYAAQDRLARLDEYRDTKEQTAA